MPLLGTRGSAALRSWGFGGVGVPAAPIIGTATRQTDGTINVQFTLGYNGGLPITSATARSSPGNITATTTSPTGGIVNVSGLTLGTTYTFVVFATNAIGNSADSAASNSQRAATFPGAPTIGTATIASPTSVTVSFTAPGSDGGETITSYTATSSPGGLTGTVNQAGSGSITVTGLTSGTAYTFTVAATNVIGTGNSSSASNQVTPQVPTYTISGPASINEGSSGNFNVVTNETVAATTIYWDISGTGVTASDFSGLSVLNGSLGISTNSTATLTLSLVADLTTEGNESFTLTFYTNSGRTTVLTGAAINGTVTGNQRTVTINDTSTTPAPTYSISANQSSVNEGSTASFSVTTTNFGTGQPPNGSGTLYWNIQSVTGSVNSGDMTTTGSVAISNNSGTISIAITADLETEGSESFRVRLYSDSGRTTLVATSGTVTINDTSLSPPQLNASATLNYNYVIAGLSSETKAYYIRIEKDPNVSATQTWTVIPTASLSIQSGIGTGASSGTFSGVITNAVVGFTGPHNSASPTVTVSASGYTDYFRGFSVPANTLYTPYNFSRGFPQEFSSSSATARSYSQTIANTVYESISTAFTTDPIGGSARTTWFGLGRRADASGADFWGGYCVSNAITPTSLQFYNAFFTSVNDAGTGNVDYQAAITSSKSFRTGTGYDKFFDRP